MELSQVQIGEQYTYFPPKKLESDNLHFPVTVEAIGKRVRVRLFMEGSPGGGNSQRERKAIGYSTGIIRACR